MPWDKEAILDSVKRTRRLLIVHEDGLTAGFGAEIAAVVAEQAFFNLDAPVSRMAVPDVPIPYNVPLMESILPSVSGIREKLAELIGS
jgi:2-oxoisovalerate dehydrogenase E1 component